MNLEFSHIRRENKPKAVDWERVTTEFLPGGCLISGGFRMTEFSFSLQSLFIIGS